MLARLQALNLLSAINPALSWSDDFAPLLKRVLSDENRMDWKLPEKVGSLPLPLALAYIAWLVQYPIDDAASIVQRLRLSNDLLDNLTATCKLLADLPRLTNQRPSQVTARLDDATPIALYMVDLLKPPEAARQLIRRYLQTWQNTWPIADGNTLREMQIQPGPHYRQILSELRAAWLDGEISSPEAENRLLQELLKNLPEHP